MNSPVIRAVIPFYEGEPYIEKCLASLYVDDLDRTTPTPTDPPELDFTAGVKGNDIPACSPPNELGGDIKP